MTTKFHSAIIIFALVCLSIMAVGNLKLFNDSKPRYQLPTKITKHVKGHAYQFFRLTSPDGEADLKTRDAIQKAVEEGYIIISLQTEDGKGQWVTMAVFEEE